MNLNKNMLQVKHFIDLWHKREYVICYALRLKGVKRPLTVFKKLLVEQQGYTRERLTKRPFPPHLDFIQDYLPKQIEVTDPKTRKANMETFSSLFFVFDRGRLSLLFLF